MIDFGPKLGWVAITKGRFHPASALQFAVLISRVDFLVVIDIVELDLLPKHLQYNG